MCWIFSGLFFFKYCFIGYRGTSSTARTFSVRLPYKRQYYMILSFTKHVLVFFLFKVNCLMLPVFLMAIIGVASIVLLCYNRLIDIRLFFLSSAWPLLNCPLDPWFLHWSQYSSLKSPFPFIHSSSTKFLCGMGPFDILCTLITYLPALICDIGCRLAFRTRGRYSEGEKFMEDSEWNGINRR